MQKQRFHLNWQIRLFACIALLFLGGLILSRSNVVLGGLTAHTEAPSDPDQVILQGLRQALTSQRLNAADRQNLEKKLALQENLVAQRSGATEKPGAKGPAVPPIPINNLLPEPTPDSQERIIDGSESLIRPWEGSINNLWQGAVAGTYFQVLAGSRPDNPGQGLVIVIEYHPEQNQRLQHTYLAPQPSGALRIVERQAGRLACSTASGSTLYFDLTTRTFQQQ